MPKNRLLCDVIILSQKINRISEGAENLYYRLLVSVDDYGRYHAAPAIIKGHLYPLRKLSLSLITKRLNELHSVGLIKFYENNGEQYLELTNFEKYQRFRSDIKRRSDFPKAVTYSDGSDTACNAPESRLQNDKRESKEKREKSKEEEKQRAVTDSIQAIIDCFNSITGQKRTYICKETNELIMGRLNEGRVFEDFKKVIERKYSQWKNDSKMCVFIRPSTLFRPGNFEDYLNEEVPMTKENDWKTRRDEQAKKIMEKEKDDKHI